MTWASGDSVAPVAEGRFLAAGISGAQLVELDSRSHILLLEGEPAWGRLCEAVLDFMGLAAPEARGDQAELGVWTRAQAIVFARDCGFRE